MTAGDTPRAISEGDRAPAFVLQDQRGSEVEVPVVGRPNVLIFYRGDW